MYNTIYICLKWLHITGLITVLKATMVYNEGNTQCIPLLFCSTPQVIEILIYCGLTMQEMHILVLLSEMLHYTHTTFQPMCERKRAIKQSRSPHEREQRIHESENVCTFPIFSVVYSHPGMADKVDNDCTEIFLIFFLWGNINILSSQLSNIISSWGKMNKGRIEAWTERENGTWGEWLCGHWNDSYASPSVQLSNPFLSVYHSIKLNISLAQPQDKSYDKSSKKPWKICDTLKPAVLFLKGIP